MTTNGLTCQELVEIVTAYIEGTLPETERRRFDMHLEECDGCQRYLDHMRRTIATLGTLSEETIPDDARNKLLDIFRNWK